MSVSQSVGNESEFDPAGEDEVAQERVSAADVGLCGRQVYAGLVEDGREVWDEVRHALHDLEHVSHALNLLLGLCHWCVLLVLYMYG